MTNAGLSGDTSASRLRRLDNRLSHPFNVFVLELGINDMLQGIPPEMTLRNLRKIVGKVQQKNPETRLALMGMKVRPIFRATFPAVFTGIYRQLPCRKLAAAQSDS